MAGQKEGGLVARAVREALGTLVSGHMYEQLIERALKNAGFSQIPEHGSAVAEWIAGPLLHEIETAVGSDAAELVAAQLAPVVAHATHATHTAKSPRLGPTAATPTPPAAGAFGSERPTGLVAPPPTAAQGRKYKEVSTARLKLSPDQLRELQGMAGVGPTTRPQAPDQRPSTPQPNTPRRVLVATSAADAVTALQQYLGTMARVDQMTDLVGLLDALEEPDLSEPILLIDCQRPTVHVTSIGAISEDLPHGTTVMLWGGNESSWRELDRERAVNCRWVRCSHEATPSDVGSLCAMLIGNAMR